MVATVMYRMGPWALGNRSEIAGYCGNKWSVQIVQVGSPTNVEMRRKVDFEKKRLTEWIEMFEKKKIAF